ncbi:hypothetical protein [Pseudomonas oryzihabitans]|uniref:hypothetical protein n=1 Tax=Pseudomonas oryzihabitans TaxID=47885 RepID=UPI0015E27082|nr:hypothetical protein [Pseudomonas psychrotolerans]
MINRAVLQQAFDLLEHLQSRGVDAIIAGGCARDIFFGVKPKDVDIIVAGAEMSHIKEILDEANIANAVFHLYRGEVTSDRIIGGYKLLGADIDVVLYRCENTFEAIDAFDFNLNQFAIVGAYRGIDGAMVRFVGDDHWGKLVAVREDANPERQSRMLAKYLDLVPRRATAEVLPSEVSVGGLYGPF